MRKASTVRLTLGAGIAAVALAAGAVPGAQAGVKRAPTNWATVESISAGGGMTALVRAAKAEGTLTVTTLPPTWANYGAIMAAFKHKYGIQITDTIPDGSSQDELNEITHEKNRGPDVVDVGLPFAVDGAQAHLFSPYKVQEWSQLTPQEKAANGDWYFDYGGYISIGYDASRFKVAPTSFADLLKPEFKGAVGLDGNPTQAGAAFSAVYAAALANRGSFANIKPGIAYFQKLAKVGNFVTAQADATTIGSGQVGVSIDWDYLNAAYSAGLKGKIDWKVVIPTDAHYVSDYVQAISRYAPHPAAARLWEEFLYSNTGQNLFLGGLARPVLLPDLIASKTVNGKWLKELPPVSGTVTFPTLAQQTAAKAIVVQGWPSVG